MAKILISEKTDPICARLLREGGLEVDERPSCTAEELLEIIGNYDGLVVRGATKVTAEVLRKAGPRLKLVGRAGAGVDTIDVAAATECGIKVMNTPGQNANAVAELVLGLMLALVRQIVPAVISLKEGRWEKKAFGNGTELLNKTVGIIGYGAIGRRLGHKAQGLGMKVMAHDPLLEDQKLREAGAEPASVEDILRQADFVSLHLPKTPQTTNLINAEALAKMKPTAILVNCARGGLVDEAALAEALKAGRLAGAAGDVYAQEPPAVDNPLVACPQFIGTPHLGASTAESQVNVAEAIARQFVDYFNNGVLNFTVN